MSGKSGSIDGSVTRLADGVFAFMQNAQGGWGFNNTALICSHGQTLLIDTTSDIPMTQKMMAAYRNADPCANRIDVLFLTHWHVDHVHGACIEDFTGSRIIASEKCADWMADLPPKAWLAMIDSLTGEAKAEMDSHLKGYFDFSGLTPVVPTQIFNGCLTFTMGDEKVEIVETGMSHTRSDSLVHIPGKRFVQLGDITIAESIQSLQYPGMANLISSLRLAIGWDAEFYLSGHGRVMNLADMTIRLEHCQWLEHEARVRHEKGMSVSDATDDLTRNLGPYKSWAGAVGLYWTVKMLYAEFEGRLEEYARRNYPKYLATSRRLKQEFPKKFSDLSTVPF